MTHSISSTNRFEYQIIMKMVAEHQFPSGSGQYDDDVRLAFFDCEPHSARLSDFVLSWLSVFMI